MAVSAATEAKLREAMARLLAGRPQRTNGALTKENLAREAGVSHASVHRAQEVLAEWNANVARPVLRTPGEVRRDEELDAVKDRLREANRRATELQRKLDALATVTANLYHENLALRSKLKAHRGTVTALAGTGATTSSPVLLPPDDAG